MYSLLLIMKAGFQYLVNPLIGCNPDVLRKIENRFDVDPEFRVKYRRSKIISRLLHELARLDRIRYQSLRNRIFPDVPPVFIIGHWRSGTSFLHNLLCQVYPAAFTTTYQAAFPNNLFAFKGLIRFFMWAFMPRKRPTDEMKMHPDLPQEEEIALGQERFFSFYYWFYFPRHAEQLADEFMYLENTRQKESKKFQMHYEEYIRRCKLNTGGEVFISKNPVNTGRIPVLLDIFPDARFIYMKRDPYETIQSSMIFFESLLKGISLQNFDSQKLQNFVLGNYKRLVLTYLDKKELIPREHLIELTYEEFIRHPSKILYDVIRQLDLSVPADLSRASILLDENRDFQSRKYIFSNPFIREVNNKLDDLIERQGYPSRKPRADEQMNA